MKALTKASRVNTALQVIQRMNAGMSVVEACRLVGMPRSSFYYFVENNPEAIAEIQAIIDANQREQLGLILLSKNEILRKVIESGLAEETKPRDRLAIFAKLNAMEEEMGQNLRQENELGKQAQEIMLTGPRTVKAKSTFTHTQTVKIETEE